MAFRCCNTESSPTIVVESVNFPSYDVQTLHQHDFSLVSRVKQTELVLGYRDFRNLLHGVSNSFHTAVSLEVLDDFIVRRIVEGSRAPSIFWIHIVAVLYEVLDDLDVPIDRCQVHWRSLVVVSTVQINILDVQSNQGFQVTLRSSDTSSDNCLDQRLVRFTCAISLLLILVKEVDVVINLRELLDDSNAFNRVTLLFKGRGP